MDMFHPQANIADAERFEKTNDAKIGTFFTDKKYLWGSHGVPDLSNQSNEWMKYHDAPTYARLSAIKNTVDPSGVFTPNRFAVGTPRSGTPFIQLPLNKIVAEPSMEEMDQLFGRREGSRYFVFPDVQSM